MTAQRDETLPGNQSPGSKQLPLHHEGWQRVFARGLFELRGGETWKIEGLRSFYLHRSKL